MMQCLTLLIEQCHKCRKSIGTDSMEMPTAVVKVKMKGTKKMKSYQKQAQRLELLIKQLKLIKSLQPVPKRAEELSMLAYNQTLSKKQIKILKGWQKEKQRQEKIRLKLQAKKQFLEGLGLKDNEKVPYQYGVKRGGVALDTDKPMKGQTAEVETTDDQWKHELCERCGLRPYAVEFFSTGGLFYNKYVRFCHECYTGWLSAQQEKAKAIAVHKAIESRAKDRPSDKCIVGGCNAFTYDDTELCYRHYVLNTIEAKRKEQEEERERRERLAQIKQTEEATKKAIREVAEREGRLENI